jgi:hypothetical protein
MRQDGDQGRFLDQASERRDRGLLECVEFLFKAEENLH